MLWFAVALLLVVAISALLRFDRRLADELDRATADLASVLEGE